MSPIGVILCGESIAFSKRENASLIIIQEQGESIEAKMQL